MVSEEEKQQFLKDQMKAMAGPCMITFAIPLTIPGLTLTLVVYSGDTTFPKYGALHVIGLIFLAVSVILIVLGCIFRCKWKPRMDPEVIQQLTPSNSMRSRSRRDVEAGKRERTLNNVFKGDGKSNGTYSPRPTPPSENPTQIVEKETVLNENNSYTQNRLPPIRNQTESIDGIYPKDTNNQNIENAGGNTISDDSYDSAGNYFQNRHKKNTTPITSPRHSRHLAPLLITKKQPSERPDSPTDKSPSYDEIQNWRRRKKKSKLRSNSSGVGVDNHGSECDEQHSDYNMLSGKAIKQQTANRVDESESEEENMRRNGILAAENSLSEKDGMTTEKRRRKKKRKKKLLKPVDNKDTFSGANNLEQIVSHEDETNKTLKHNAQNVKKAGDDLDYSDASIGSTDSVLAQYTSRSLKNQREEIEQN